MTELTIRPAVSADLPGLHRLYDEIHRQHVDGAPWIFRMPPRHARTDAFLRERMASLRAALLVAVDAGCLVGLVEVEERHTSARADFVPRVYAWIDTLIVDASNRRRGVGRRLMQAAHRWARSRDLDDVFLSVWAFNEDALAFYEDLGYEPILFRLYKSNDDDLPDDDLPDSQ